MPSYFDWMLGLSAIGSLYLLGRKLWQGWTLMLLNNALLFPILNIHNRNYGLLPLDVVSVLLAFRGLYLWKLSRNLEERG